ncbi:acireductone synthase [Marinicellulosiphila megalodicopiae]|uniref:acireductone synthase n=1 Tax=Marinicellulosiphila megalodicopiae TaxID=2724896 RepID=UPI003BAEFB3C
MIKAIITDIEGTITRISFVKEILFPYAKKQLPDFIRQNQTQKEVAIQINETKRIMQNEKADLEIDLDLEAVIAQLLQWIEDDQKITPLKQLQGLVWFEGYSKGDFTGHIYNDAMEFLNQVSNDYELYVYSSGSVKAQQLLFQYSDFGDIRPLFKDYFDTLVGGKKEVQSYNNIIKQINIAAEQVLFLSDILQELDAAKSAGLQTCQLLRDGQATSDEHVVINDFTEFDIEDFK